jgi:hypothetical protein
MLSIIVCVKFSIFVYHWPSFVILVPLISFFLLLHRALPWYGVGAAEPLDKDRVGDKGAAGGSRRSRSLLHHHFLSSFCQCFWSRAAFIKIRLLFYNTGEGKGVPANNMARIGEKTTIYNTLETKKIWGSLCKAGVFETKLKNCFRLFYVLESFEKSRSGNF